MNGLRYRRSCATCHGPIAVIETDKGMKSIAICPKCSNRPDLADVISRMPTLGFIEHAKDCNKCGRAGTRSLCDVGIGLLAAYPGYWSEALAKGCER